MNTNTGFVEHSHVIYILQTDDRKLRFQVEVWLSKAEKKMEKK